MLCLQIIFYESISYFTTWHYWNIDRLDLTVYNNLVILITSAHGS